MSTCWTYPPRRAEPVSKIGPVGGGITGITTPGLVKPGSFNTPGFGGVGGVGALPGVGAGGSLSAGLPALAKEVGGLEGRIARLERKLAACCRAGGAAAGGGGDSQTQTVVLGATSLTMADGQTGWFGTGAVTSTSDPAQYGLTLALPAGWSRMTAHVTSHANVWVAVDDGAYNAFLYTSFLYLTDFTDGPLPVVPGSVTNLNAAEGGVPGSHQTIPSGGPIAVTFQNVVSTITFGIEARVATAGTDQLTVTCTSVTAQLTKVA